MPGARRAWAKWILRLWVPPNISAFLWRMLRHTLPVDSRIQTRGILLASRCRCCNNPQQETIRHLFTQSEVAMAVWKYFGEIFDIPSQFNSILQALTIWMATTSKDTQYGICRATVVAYIFR